MVNGGRKKQYSKQAMSITQNYILKVIH